MDFKLNEREELLYSLRKKLTDPETPVEDRGNISEMIKDLIEYINLVKDEQFENPALSIHNLIFL